MEQNTGQASTAEWRDLKAKIRGDFPRVNHLSVAELSTWLNDKARTAPMLIDCRAAEEHAMSHLPNARLIEPNVDLEEAAADLDRKQPIVLYCSVGIRSSKMAEQFQKLGYTHVSNLEGSIFEWANEGLPMFQNAKPTDVVHPFNQKWGRLLNEKHHPREE
jgi:rhodanese-related sulfurtransferase